MSEVLASTGPPLFEVTVARTATGFHLSVRESRTGMIRFERDLAVAPLTALRRFDPNNLSEDEIDRLIQPVAPGAPELSDDDERAALQELSRSALTNESLRRLMARHPVPEAYHDEPGWDDDVAS